MSFERAGSAVLRQAKQLASDGDVDGAINILIKIGAVEHAAAILMRAKRPLEAGNLLMDSLGLHGVDELKLQERIPGLRPTGKERALKAAICFSRAREIDHAVAIYVALGETRRAAELLSRKGQHARAARLRTGAEGARPDVDPTSPSHAIEAQEEELAAARELEAEGKEAVAIQHYLRLGKLTEAARVAYGMKEFRQAAQLYAECENYYNAGICLLEAGERRDALDHFLQVLPEHAQYRIAQLHVANIVVSIDLMDFATESYLAELVETVPRDSKELETYYQLARHFERHRMPSDAQRAYEQVLLISDYKEARERMSRLMADALGGTEIIEPVGPEPAPPVADGGPLDLPDLPPPPSLPDLPDFAPLEDGEYEVPAPVPPPEGQYYMPYPEGAPPPEKPKEVLHAKKLKHGTILADRYRVEGKVGRGGMAAVYRAMDTELDELVAIKVFTRDDQEEVSLARFKQEVSLTRRLSHPNIVKLFDIGEAQGLRFMTMELLDGRDLSGFIRKPMDLLKGLNWLIQMCRGLYAAHKAGVIHRDIKPANIFVCNDGRVKLMDFGIAKRSNKPGVTQKGLAWGTPRYMAPEQIRGFSKVSPASDLYSVGIIAYQMFTGRVPFDHKEQVPLLMMHINDKPRPPEQLNAQIPKQLSAVILKCLAKKPKARFADAKELANTLREIVKQLKG